MKTFTVYDLKAFTPEDCAAALVPHAPAQVDFFGVMMPARYATTQHADVLSQYRRSIAYRVIAYPNRIAPSLHARMVCDTCGAANCKLWRQYQTFAAITRLLCGPCALVDQKKDGPLNDQGQRWGDDGFQTDQIGRFVPAVPIGDTFWGYSSGPAEAIAWWRALPSYPGKRQC